MTPQRGQDEAAVRQLVRGFVESAAQDLVADVGRFQLVMSKRAGQAAPETELEPATSADVRSPRVGVFRPARSIGDVVEASQVVGVVDVLGEAIDVRAGAAGVVARIDAEDGEFVEYGQVLMLIEARPAP